jgi:hypothetical protein
MLAAMPWGQLGEERAVKQWFGPRSYRGGRVQIFGCSPGCLLLSLLGSLLLTLALNLLLRAL